MSLKHGRDAERARHINAIYTEIALNGVRQKESENQTEKERLETVLKDATRNLVRILFVSFLSFIGNSFEFGGFFRGAVA